MGVIAHFAEAVRPPPRAVADAAAQALGELVARRRQVIEMMVAERNRARLVTQLRIVTQPAWRRLRFQPHSALAQWVAARTGGAKGRIAPS